MKNLKNIVHKYGPQIIKNVGYIVNPIILKFKKEHNNLLIFYFHGLFESHTQKDLHHLDPQTNMSTKAFDDFIDYFLSAKYKFVSPEDLKDLNNDNAHAIITFDDGYFNNMLAVDILKKYKIPGVFFLSTKNIVENQSYWWDIIYKYRKKSGVCLEKIRKEQNSLKKFKSSYIDDYILKNFGKDSFKPWSDLDRPFTEEEVRNISKNPFVSIGNHTHSHAILTNCNKKEITEELEISNNILKDLTNKQPISVAFPNGNINSDVLKVAEKMGFQYGFTTKPGINSLPLKNEKFIHFKRYITGIRDITEFGSFRRIGYEPHDLYYNLISKSKNLIGFRGKKK